MRAENLLYKDGAAQCSNSNPNSNPKSNPTSSRLRLKVLQEALNALFILPDLIWKLLGQQNPFQTLTTLNYRVAVFPLNIKNALPALKYAASKQR